MQGLDEDARRQEVEGILDRLEATPQAQWHSIERGLQLTEQALLASRGSAADVAPEETSRTATGLQAGDAQAAARRSGTELPLWWCAARLRLLQHQERLETALALSGGSWIPAAYASLRDCTVAEAAAAAAAAGRLPAVALLLSRHPRALLPSVLDALSAAPETLEAKHFAPLLRQVTSLRQPLPLPREPDWAESAGTAAELKEAGQYALLLATEPMCAVSSGGGTGWRPPTQRKLAQWVCQRAQQVDATTGQLPNALALLEASAAAVHYGEPSIGALLSLGQELLSLIKLGASRADSSNGSSSSSSAWRTDLRQYASLRPQQRLSLLLGLLGGDSLASDLRLHVAPFLARLGGGAAPSGRGSNDGDGGSSGGGGDGLGDEHVDPQVVLRQALEAESSHRLSWVVRLIQAEARDRAAFSSAAQLAKTAAACCYASGATDAWELLNSMLSTAREALRADAELGQEEREAAEGAVAAARGHVSAARLLTKHGLTTPVSTVRDSDRAAALRLLRTLLARVSRTKNTESRWVEVWMDLRSIQEHGFGQLTEEEVRAELCRALLRVGQYRLCKTYLQGLQPEVAEQLVVTSGREVFLSASSMADRAVKQAKECFALLPASAAAQEQLAGITSAEQLHRLGLDLPPLQLQQLRAQATSSAGGSQVLEQLLTDHPCLAAADSQTLGQLAAALGLAHQQQPLLLRAATAAHAAGNLRHAESLLLLLAEQHYKPAWELAAAVASDPACRRGSRQQLLVFALASAPADRLSALLLQWQAADGGQEAGGDGCWELFSATGAAADSPDGWAEQQRWLARQLRLHLIALGRSSSSSSNGGSSSGNGGEASIVGSGSREEAAALGCLLALGPRGLQLWEKILSEPLPWPLGQRQRRRALLLGLTAGALLALQPAGLEPGSVAAAVAEAQARLEAPPAQLLHLVHERQQKERTGLRSGGSGSGSSSSIAAMQRAASAGEEGAASELEEPASSSEVSTAAAAPAGAAAATAAVAATAAAAAAERFHSLLLAAADAQQLQRLLPGVDAAAALAGGRDSRRRLVLQLAAAAAGKPVPLRTGAAAAAAAAVSRSTSSPAPSPRQEVPGTANVDSSSNRSLQRAASRKKVEASPVAGSAGAAGGSPEVSALGGSGSPSVTSWQQQLDPEASADMLQQALALGAKSGVAVWEVHLAFVEALLSSPQQQQQHEQQWGRPGVAAAQQMLRASLPVLLAGAQPATELLQVLLHRVWPRTSSRWPRHLCSCLELMQQCCEALAAVCAAGSTSSSQGSSSSAEPWLAVAAAFASCRAAAEQLLQAAGGIHSKLFIQPVVQLLAQALPAGTSSTQPAAADAAADAPQADVAAVNQQLLLHVSSSNIVQLAAAVGQLAQQHAAWAAAAAAGAAGSSSSSGDGSRRSPGIPDYPCSSSTVHLALFCSCLTAGTSEWTAARAAAPAVDLQLCRQCLLGMAPEHAAAAAAFAATDGPFPLALPPSSQQPTAVHLSEEQQLTLLAAALEVLTAAAAAAQLPTAVQQLAPRLRQRHALLAVWSSLAPVCPSASQLGAARAAAASLQQAALASSGSGSSSTETAGTTGAECPAELLCCLQQLLTTGCPAAGVLQAAALLQAFQGQPEQAPSDAAALLASPAAAAAPQQAVAAAAEEAVADSLVAMSGGVGRAGAGGEGGQVLSAGDAVQNLFALLRSLHPLPAAAASSNRGGDDENSNAEASVEAAAVAATAEAVGALRLLVWQHLQEHAAAYDGTGGAAETEAHVQVLELLGTVGTASMWPGWSPPAAALPAADAEAGAEAQGSSSSSDDQRRLHQRALLFTRTAALLAVEWPEAVQRCRLAASDFGSADAAEGALLRLAVAAEGPQHLRLLLRLLLEGLAGAFPAPSLAAEAAAEAGTTAAAEGSPGGAAAGHQEQDQRAGTAAAAAGVVPLHRVWATCLRMLLPFGDLSGVLAALEEHRAHQERQQQAQKAATPEQQGQRQRQDNSQLGQPAQLAAPAAGAAAVTEEEAGALLEAADATQGPAAAAAIALLLPYRPMQRARWRNLLQACGSAGSAAADIAGALPGLAPLLLLVVQQQPERLAELAAGERYHQQQFQLLIATGLLQQQQQGNALAAAAYVAPLGGSALTLHTAVAAAATAQLSLARQYSSAGWLAMQVSGTPRLLRVLDSSTRVLQQLLRSCADGSPAAAGAAAAAQQLAAGACGAAFAGLALPHTAARLLEELPAQCSRALEQLSSDLQL